MQKILVLTICLFSCGVWAEDYASEVKEKLENPIFNQGIINSHNIDTINSLGRNYARQNSINPGWLGLFRRYNSSETMQYRTILETFRTSSMMIFEFDDVEIFDWKNISVDHKNDVNLRASVSALAIDTTHILREDSPVFLMLLSNQHVISDYLSNPALKQLVKRGAVVAVMEYPGYGISVGQAGKQSWLEAVSNSVNILHDITGKKVYLVGHSIGGPLALEAAAQPQNVEFVAGAISYAGFTNVYEMAKDHVTSPALKFFSQPITWLTARNHNFNGVQMEALARQETPALILHGEYDGAVTPRHFYMYKQNIIETLEKYPSAKLESMLFEDHYHDEINNFISIMPESFNVVWDRIFEFVSEIEFKSSQFSHQR